jgi:hypothetical protein
MNHIQWMALAVLLTLSTGIQASAKTDFRVSLIPDSLKKNAFSVIRLSQCDYTYRNPTSATARYDHVVTILHKEGISESYFVEAGDKSTKLIKFKATITDAVGKKIKTYGRSDIEINAISSHLATDNYRYYLNFSEPALPFTIHYEYEMEYSDGIYYFPVFMPVGNHNQSVEKAIYNLTTPAATTIHVKTSKFEGQFTKQEAKGLITRQWTVNGYKSFDYERFEPSFINLVPVVYSGPKEFVYEKTTGEITNAQTIIQWIKDLSINRTELTQATKDQITAMTSGLKTEREKVEALYNHLGKTTRYESIQLGVGGYQPIAAAEVCRTGFGDCKGLSNYLKAMLNHLGIEANHSIIRSDNREKELADDFTAVLKSNHMILQVPLQGDTLWLECTNTKVPFGYVHSDIAGHHAIVNYDRGGKMERLPDYPDSLNIELNKMQIQIEPDGKASGTIRKSLEVKQYDGMMGFATTRIQDQTDKLRKEINLPQATIQNIRITENKSALPSMLVVYEISTNQYGTKTGNRLFLPVNVMRSTGTFFKKGERKQDIVIYEGWVDVDEITINIPEDFSIESTPSPVTIENEFGHFVSNITVDGKTITIKQTLSVKSGQWKAASYPSLRELFEKAVSGYSGKIIIRK